MASSSSSISASSAAATTIKGTRKTYSFEERETLVTLIGKYLIKNYKSTENDNHHDDEEAVTVEGKSAAETASTARRKSAWGRLTHEYNSLVGPENARSSIQLRRCWENMKANKKNRDDKRISEMAACESLFLATNSNVGLLQPNVVYHSKDTGPCTPERLPLPNILPSQMKKEDESMDDATSDKHSDDVNQDTAQSADELQPLEIDETPPTTGKRMRRKNSISPTAKKTKKEKPPKLNKVQKNHELYEYTISEAQLRLETTALTKEEAKLKLEEAEYRKEEARMRMICASYDLHKLREACEEARVAAVVSAATAATKAIAKAVAN